MAQAFKQDPDGLVDISTDGTERVSGLAAIGQEVAFALRRHRGSYPLDRSVGIDWGSLFRRKPYDLIAIRLAVITEVTRIESVQRVLNYSSSVNGRDLNVSFDVQVDLGDDSGLIQVDLTTGSDGPLTAVLVAVRAIR